MADIQSAAAEIRRGKKERRRKKKNKLEMWMHFHSMKIYMVSLFHRATINNSKKIPESPARGLQSSPPACTASLIVGSSKAP